MRRRLAEAMVKEEQYRGLKLANDQVASELFLADDVYRAAAMLLATTNSDLESIPEVVSRAFEPSRQGEILDTVEEIIYRARVRMAATELVEGVTMDDAILLAAENIKSRRASAAPITKRSANDEDREGIQAGDEGGFRQAQDGDCGNDAAGH
ncbi:MAG: hypothetical protein IAF94_12630 [Pirellulaceae bacterium]|nr:hypothetical protein [Pirellulaceae bacterium]